MEYLLMRYTLLLLILFASSLQANPVTKVANQYIKSHLRVQSIKVLESSIYRTKPNWWSYKAIVDGAEFNLTVIHSDGKWTALELESTINYAKIYQ